MGLWMEVGGGGVYVSNVRFEKEIASILQVFVAKKCLYPLTIR